MNDQAHELAFAASPIHVHGDMRSKSPHSQFRARILTGLTTTPVCLAIEGGPFSFHGGMTPTDARALSVALTKAADEVEGLAPASPAMMEYRAEQFRAIALEIDQLAIGRPFRGECTVCNHLGRVWLVTALGGRMNQHTCPSCGDIKAP